MANSYKDILNKRKRDWNCDTLMDGAMSKKGRKLPFSSPLLNYSTYGGIPRNQITEFFGDPGGGKSQPMYSRVLTSSGFKYMADIRVGDIVYDGKGNLCEVDGVYPQGVRDIYEITTSMNNSIRVGDNHLNSVFTVDPSSSCRVDHTVETEDLLEMFVNLKEGQHIFIDTPSIEFNHVDTVVHPYVAGFVTSAGRFLDKKIVFDIRLKHDLRKLSKLISPMKLEVRNNHWTIVSDDEHDEAYIELGRIILHDNIHDCYMYNDKASRREFIDGCIDATSVEDSMLRPVVLMVSYGKSNDFAFMVRSVGMLDEESMFKADPSYLTKFPRTAIVYQHSLQNTTYTDTGIQAEARYIKSIVKVDSDECQCIHVTSDEHTYISDDFIPTHNTTTAVDICKKAYEIFESEYENQCYELREKVSKGNKQASLDLDEITDRGPKKILYIDLEHSFDADWANKLGIEPGTIDIMQPPDVVAEDLLQTVQELIETGELGLVVLDSIPSLTTRQELDKKYGERTVASLAGLLTVFFRKIIPLLSRYECTLLIINQVRDNMDNPYVVNTPGGKALKFYCSLRMLFRIGSPVDFLGNELSSNTENPAGYIVTAKIVKQKSAPWDRRNGSYYLMAQSGIRIDMDFAKLAVTKYGIIKKSGAWFTVCDPYTGEVLEENDKPVKLNGMSKVFDYLQQNPEYYKKLQDYILADIEGTDNTDEETEDSYV